MKSQNNMKHELRDAYHFFRDDPINNHLRIEVFS